MKLPPPIRGMRAAFVFLTRLPVGGFPYTADEWRWSTAHFPLLGAVLGAVLGALFVVMRPAGPWVAAAVVLAASMLITGAFHEDGLADTADALGGAYERARVFEILKDSRLGSFGVAALAMSLLLRGACLAALGPAAPMRLAFVSCAARTPPIWLMRALPYVTRDDASKSRLVARAGTPQTVVATLWPILLGSALMFAGRLTELEASLSMLAGVVAASVCGYRFHVRAGGITGDFLGAAEQVSEILMLLVLAWLHGRGLFAA